MGEGRRRSGNDEREEEVDPPTSHTGESIIDTEMASMMSGTVWQEVGEVLEGTTDAIDDGIRRRPLLEAAEPGDRLRTSDPTTGEGGGGGETSNQETAMEEEESTTVGGSASGATPGPSTSSSGATGGEEGGASIPPALQQLPETIDREVLAALPENIQQEILAQHAREQRAREARREGFATAISPEFLSALPPNIQEEVCTMY